MQTLDLCAPCLFGLEGLVADELRRMGIGDVSPENGRVYFRGTVEDMARANLWLRCAERVLIVLGRFEARSFDELFEGARALPWEDYLPMDASFPLRGHCLDSALMSVPDCRSILKKAIAGRLGARYHMERLPETGARYQVRFSIQKNRVALYLDSSGPGLHKRGYRAHAGEAPLKETLAAAMVTLSRYRGKGPFCDPFCGSGTIVIEAALIAMGRAPGLKRHFDFEQWHFSRDLLGPLKEAARAAEYDRSYDLWGGDTDPATVAQARENAGKAGVDHLCRFETADARAFRSAESRGTMVTNPPYGMRLMDQPLSAELMRAFGAATRPLDRWGIYILSADAELERNFGRRADKKRKLYNGMLKCELYCFTDSAKGRGTP